MIDGREEEIITIACTGSVELAGKLARYVNHHREIIGTPQTS
jgi:hypothetical protein